MDPNIIINRVARLARLDTSVFDEVRDDPAELTPSMIVALVSCLLAGLGSFLYWQIVPSGTPDNAFLNAFLLGSVFMAVIFAVMVLVVYVVMAQMYRVEMDLYALFRTSGYAALPLALSVFMFVPMIYPMFALAPLGLMLVFLIYAVQSASNADSSQVVMSSFIGFSVFCLVLGLLAIATSFPDAPAGAGIFGLFFDL